MKTSLAARWVEDATTQIRWWQRELRDAVAARQRSGLDYTSVVNRCLDVLIRLRSHREFLRGKAVPAGWDHI